MAGGVKLLFMKGREVDLSETIFGEFKGLKKIPINIRLFIYRSI